MPGLTEQRVEEHDGVDGATRAQRRRSGQVPRRVLIPPPRGLHEAPQLLMPPLALVVAPPGGRGE